MRRHLSRDIQGVLLAVGVTATMGAVRLAFGDRIGSSSTFIPFVIPVMLAGYYGGIRPGLVATGVSCFFIIFVLISPPLSFRIEHLEEAWGVATFVFCGVTISVLCEMLHAARRHAEAKERELAGETAERRRAQQMVAATLESITDGFNRFDRDWRYVYVNAEGERIAGRSRSELLGRVFWEVWPALRGTATETAFRRAVAEQATVELEDYSEQWERWYAIKAYPMHDGGLAVYSHEITDRKRAEEEARHLTAALQHHVEKLESVVTQRKKIENELRASQEQIQLVTDSMSAAVTRCSRDLRYLWVSRPYADWIGLPVDRIIGKPILDIVGQEAFDQLRPHFERVLSGQKVAYEDQVNFRGLGPRWINALYTPNFDADGSVDGWVAVVTDIQDRKLAEEALRRADRKKDEFVATLAHELRNPLAPIRNAVRILKEAGPSAEELQWSRDVIDRQVHQMSRLLDDLLDVSRISRNKLQLRRERVPLSGVVARALETSAPHVDSYQHRLTVDIPDPGIVLDADPVRLAQVLSNLLNNAAKYTERGGEIWLRGERQGSDIVLSVRDSGIGIDAETLPRIFEMFSQGESAAEHAEGGLGIGLSLVRGVVELHGGSVEARSKGLGTGSEFLVRLPLLLDRAGGKAAPEPIAGEEAHGPSVPCRVLVVDDSRDAAESMAIMLRHMGHVVAVAHDGIEGVETAQAFAPDVVFLDIGMPRMNGYEAARRIRKEPWGKSMVLIALTGWGQAEDKRQALEAGCDRHLTKPVDPNLLESLLQVVAVAPRS